MHIEIYFMDYSEDLGLPSIIFLRKKNAFSGTNVPWGRAIYKRPQLKKTFFYFVLKKWFLSLSPKIKKAYVKDRDIYALNY